MLPCPCRGPYLGLHSICGARVDVEAKLREHSWRGPGETPGWCHSAWGEQRELASCPGLPTSSQRLGWSQQGWVDESKAPEQWRERPTGDGMGRARGEV